MTDTYLRVVLNQVAAFTCAVVLSNLLGMLGQLVMKAGVGSALLSSLGPTLVGSLVVSIFVGSALAPLGLLDALVIRPMLGARVNLGVLFATEYIVLILYRCAIQFRGIADGSQADRFALAKRLLIESAVFLLIYFALSALFTRISFSQAGQPPARI